MTISYLLSDEEGKKDSNAGPIYDQWISRAVAYGTVPENILIILVNDRLTPCL